jgi:hypothetical protein
MIMIIVAIVGQGGGGLEMLDLLKKDYFFQ